MTIEEAIKKRHGNIIIVRSSKQVKMPAYQNITVFFLLPQF